MTDVPFLDLAAAVADERAGLDAIWARFLDSGRFILGPEVESFEAAFAAACGASHAVGFGNGLDALAIMLQAAGLVPGDEVVVPAHTFIASWQAVAMAGAVPVAAEPAPGSFLSGEAEMAAAITPRTRALMAVHLYGEIARMEALVELAQARGLLLFEDAAQAAGARRFGAPAGSLGLAAGFSFYPAKNLGALGDAGAAVTCDAELARRMRLLGNYGSERKYEHIAEGRNSRLDPLQAMVLAMRLPRLEAANAVRRAIAARYCQALAGVDGLDLPPREQGCTPSWHLFVIRTPRRDALRTHLAALGIGTQLHYPRPVYRFAPFAEAAPPMGSPADALCDTILSLPIGPHQSEAQTEAVIAGVRGFFGG